MAEPGKVVRPQSASAGVASPPVDSANDSTQQSRIRTASTLQGSVQVLILYDVSEEIRLQELREILGARPVVPSFKSAAPGYVRFARPPVAEPVDPIQLDGGLRLEGQIKYYDYGVVSVLFEMPFSGEWQELVKLASGWMWDANFEKYATEIARKKLERAGPALVKPYKEWLNEDYFMFHIRDINGQPSADELLSLQGQQIAQIVRGETGLLSENETKEVLQSSISYYPNDLAVIGWNGAFIYDTAAGAQTALELLEYANSQLLEFRHYDELLTRELAGVYRLLDRGRGMRMRWRLAREATRLNTVLLDVTELSERADNAIKFLSDMFSARMYRLAASKVGVLDYKNLVGQKLRTADELYRFMVQEFHQGRAFALELMVVIILIIEIVFLFKGKP